VRAIATGAPNRAAPTNSYEALDAAALFSRANAVTTQRNALRGSGRVAGTLTAILLTDLRRPVDDQ